MHCGEARCPHAKILWVRFSYLGRDFSEILQEYLFCLFNSTFFLCALELPLPQRVLLTNLIFGDAACLFEAMLCPIKCRPPACFCYQMLALHHGLHLDGHLARLRPGDVGNVLSVLFIKTREIFRRGFIVITNFRNWYTKYIFCMFGRHRRLIPIKQ